MGKVVCRRTIVWSLLGLCLLIGLAQVGVSYVDVGATIEFGGNLTGYDLSSVPQSVADDAGQLAREMFGTGAQYRDFASQLVSAYAEARDSDFILVFNPGGWGTTSVVDAPGWKSIIGGIKSELASGGFDSVVLEYRRTTKTMLGRWKEFVEALNRYPSKSRDLAERIEFLTAHLPEARVIVTGESNGTVVSDYAMQKMRDNGRVYSIQTGLPFWHQQVVRERTLMLNSNGIRPDALSRGEVPTIVWGTVKQWLHLAAPQDAAHMGGYLNAPGHEYFWQYPEVYTVITSFLQANFLSGSGSP